MDIRKGADTMLRILAIALVTVLLAAPSASAVTSQEKMETCKIGAESQQLQGPKRIAFIKKCMAGGNYEPLARKNAKAAPKPQ
jgi:psiF repeat